MEYYMNLCWQNNVCVSRGLKARIGLTQCKSET